MASTFISGDKFSMLTLTGKSYMDKNFNRIVETVCDCGNISWKRLHVIKKGGIKSCGCLAAINCQRIALRHGLSSSTLYRIWNKMKDRCYNNKHIHYKSYGGRGIEVCEEWLNDFMSFYNWAINNGWSEGLTLDRINNANGYSTFNCKFSTAKQQGRNRRNNFLITAFGNTKCASEWADDERCT